MSVGDVCFSKGAIEVHINSVKNSTESANLIIRAVEGGDMPCSELFKTLELPQQQPFVGSHNSRVKKKKEVSEVLKDSKI